MSLGPRDVSYIRDIVLDKLARDQDILQLESLKQNIVHAILTTPALALPPNTVLFRAELLLLVAIIDHIIDGTKPPACPDDLTAQIVEVIGTDIEDTAATTLCTTYVVSPGIDRRFKGVYPYMIGRMHAGLALDHIKSEYTYHTIGNEEHPDIIQRFSTILGSLATSCGFTATMDLFLNLSLKPLLQCERLALLKFHPKTITLESYPRQCPGDESNDTIQDLIQTTAGDRFERIDWETSRNTTDYIFVIVLLSEFVSRHNITTYVNCELTYSESDPLCNPCISSMNFVPFGANIGVVHRKKIVVVDDAVRFPILTTALYLIRQRIECASDPSDVIGYTQLLQCCEDPDHAMASNPFLSKLGIDYDAEDPDAGLPF